MLDLPREAYGEHYEVLRHGGGGAPAGLVCGAVRADHPAARQLVERLPAVVEVAEVAPGGSPQAEWMQSTLRLMAAEAGALRPGGETVITRLADVLVVQAIRAWLETAPAARTGWLGALRDAQIGRALALIHRDPARDWTVASLARELAMSRSAFAARFTELVDEPAMRYLARWRMHVALDRLREEGVTVGELAGRLGYRSEAAFSRAFKRIIGSPPAPPGGGRGKRSGWRRDRSGGVSRSRNGAGPFSLQGRVAVVTGGNRGLGLAIARVFTAPGRPSCSWRATAGAWRRTRRRSQGPPRGRRSRCWLRTSRGPG